MQWQTPRLAHPCSCPSSLPFFPLKTGEWASSRSSPHVRVLGAERRWRQPHLASCHPTIVVRPLLLLLLHTGMPSLLLLLLPHVVRMLLVPDRSKAMPPFKPFAFVVRAASAASSSGTRGTGRTRLLLLLLLRRC